MVGEKVCAFGFHKTKPCAQQVDALVKGKQDELSTV